MEGLGVGRSAEECDGARWSREQSGGAPIPRRDQGEAARRVRDAIEPGQHAESVTRTGEGGGGRKDAAGREGMIARMAQNTY